MAIPKKSSYSFDITDSFDEQYVHRFVGGHGARFFTNGA